MSAQRRHQKQKQPQAEHKHMHERLDDRQWHGISNRRVIIILCAACLSIYFLLSNTASLQQSQLEQQVRTTASQDQRIGNERDGGNSKHTNTRAQAVQDGREIVARPARPSSRTSSILTTKAVIDSTICLSEECIQNKAQELVRIWSDRSNGTWATHYSNPVQDAYKRGIILVKVPKTASTTSAAVALRISKRYGDIPVLYEHGLPTERRYKYRHGTESYLFSSIRHPRQRALSFLWYHFSRLQQHEDKHNATIILQQLEGMDERIQDGANARSSGRGGFQLSYLTLQRIPQYSAYSSTTPTQVLRLINDDDGNGDKRNSHGKVADRFSSLSVTQNVESIMQHYDFLLVVERMDESLVALSMRMGVTLADILVASSKVAGTSYMPVGAEPKHCIRLESPPPLKELPTTVQAFLAGDTWRAMNYGDYLLHAVADASLDRTIDAIGRHKFEMRLLEYRELKQRIHELCETEIHFPCSSDGVLQADKSAQSCYERDLGCGHACFDTHLQREGW